MANYICAPLTDVPDYLVVDVVVPTGETLYAGQIVTVESINTDISKNFSVYTATEPATATLGKQMAIIINGGFEQLSDGRRPEGQPDFTKYTFGAGEVVTAIILTPAMRFEIANDSVNLNSVTPAAGKVLFPVDGAYSLKLDAAVPAGTYSSFTVLATKYFRTGGLFGAGFASTMVTKVNAPSAT